MTQCHSVFSEFSLSELLAGGGAGASQLGEGFFVMAFATRFGWAWVLAFGQAASAGAVAGAVVSFANSMGNLGLAAAVDFTESQMNNGRDSLARDRAQAIHDQAVLHLDALVDYKVDAKRLADLQVAVDAYQQVITAPRAKRAAHRTLTAALND
jgi:hypothetical protein